MNQPYVKEYDKNGVLLNPIIGAYRPIGDNRRERRKGMHTRPFNNRGGSRVRIFKTLKFKEHIQRVDGKTIVHLTT